MTNWTSWTGNKDFYWGNPENWSNGIPEKNKHAIIPAAPVGGDFPKISSDIIIDFTLKNKGIIDNEGLMKVEKSGIIQNEGQFLNRLSATILNEGIIMNSGVFLNQGKLDNRKVFCEQEQALASFPSEFSMFFQDQKHSLLQTNS